MSPVSRPLTSLVVSDPHVPFHNKRLTAGVCKLIHDIRPDHFVIAGDFGDYRSVSRHNTGSLQILRGLTLGKEYAAQNAVLDDFDSVLPRGCLREIIEGNHESNCIRWLQTGDNGKVEGAFKMPREALRIDERGYKYHENWKEASVEIGSLSVVHGEFCTQHCAQKHLAEYEGSVMFGHTHRVQSYVTGKRGAWGIGGLFDKDNPAFGYATASQRRRWSNGFAIVHSFDDGTFLPHVVQVWNSRFTWAGKLY